MNKKHQEMLDRYAQYNHLPPKLRAISQPVCDLMHFMAEVCSESVDPAEVTVGLRKLIEAKDCFVRAMLP